MTSSDLDAWLTLMDWSVREACRQLEISNDRWRRMMAGQRIPRHIALACAAIAFGLPAWRQP